jgi:hypothetical protein
MKKTIITSIITIILVIATAFVTFVTTMNHLRVAVNEEENGALVECFGQVWYCETEEIF